MRRGTKWLASNMFRLCHFLPVICFVSSQAVQAPNFRDHLDFNLSNHALNDLSRARRARGLELGSTALNAPPRTPQLEPDPNAVSLAFVFDTTGSMHAELSQVKTGAAGILTAISERPEKPIYDYVLVQFNDPVIGPVNVTTDPEKFRQILESVKVKGGSDCPEPSLSAILKALQVVRPNSFIYVFTDASAKDCNLLTEVLALIQQKQCQVVFLITGSCKNSNTLKYQCMEDIAAASSGQVYRIMKSDITEVLVFVRNTLNSRKVNLVSVDLPWASSNEYQVEVDETIEEFTISVSGANPNISIVNPAGVVVDSPPALQQILDLDNVKIVSVKSPVPGPWTVETSSDSKHAVRLTGISVVDFLYGFSASITDSLDESHYRPLKGAANYILVGGTDADISGNLTAVDLIGINGTLLQTISLEPVDSSNGIFRGGPFTPPDDFFYISNTGFGKDGHPVKRITPTAISPQHAGLPVIQMPLEQVAYINQPFLLNCHISSLVPFKAWWSKDDVSISKKQKYVQTGWFSWETDSATEDMEGTYDCKAINVEGYSVSSTKLTVTGPPPEVYTKAKVEAFLYQQVMLNCSIKSELRYNVSWVRYRSDSVHDAEYLENSSQYLSFKNGSLLIENVGSGDQGLYLCIAHNQGGRNESSTELIVVNPLQVAVIPKNFTFHSGESFSLVCEVSGFSPAKQFFWEKNGEVLEVKETGRVRTVQFEQRLVLNVENAKETDAAIYRCVANNGIELAEDYSEGTYAEAPSVKFYHNHLALELGKDITFNCTVRGTPEPKITWLLNGVEVTHNPRFEVLPNSSLLIRNLQLEDDGVLECIGRNAWGHSKDVLNLNVGVSPKWLQKPEVVSIDILGSGVLVCNATGIPPPSVKWERESGKNMDTDRIQFDVRAGSLLLTEVTVSDEGVYTCIAENSFGYIKASGKVIITGIVPPKLYESDSVPQNTSAKISEIKELSCQVVQGNPPPIINWFKDDELIANISGINIQSNGSLIIDEVNLNHNGIYRCQLENVGGTAAKIIQLNVLEPPVMADSSVMNFSEVVDSDIILPCEARGTPEPQIKWFHSRNSELNDSSKFAIIKDGLSIKKLTKNDSGVYTCLAMNQGGISNRSIILTILEPPEIIGTNLEYIEAIMKTAVLLPCQSLGNPLPEYFWSRDNELIQYSDHILPSTNQDGLVITSIDEIDAGNYSCSAVNSVGSDIKNVILKVFDPPVIESASASEVKVFLGDDTKLFCKSRGIPAPEVVWTFRGHPLQDTKVKFQNDEHHLILSHVSENTAGLYTCTAINSVGSDSLTFKVIVQVPPNITSWTQNVSAKKGDVVELDCFAYGIPKPSVVWMKQNSSEALSQDHRLIMEVDVDSSGAYECKAQNEVGSDVKVVNLSVMSSPQVLLPSQTAIEVIAGNNVDLDCISDTTSAYPPPKIRWLVSGLDITEIGENPKMRDFSQTDLHCHNDPTLIYFPFTSERQAPYFTSVRMEKPGNHTTYTQIVDTTRTLSICNVDPSDAGQIACEAYNDAGNSSRTFTLVVLTPPVIHEVFPESVTLTEGEDFSISCSAEGNPSPQITWMKNGIPLSPDQHHENLLVMKENILVLISADNESAANYSCIAANKAGEERREVSVIVSIPLTVTNDSTIYQEVLEGEDAVLNCSLINATPVGWQQNEQPIDLTLNERSDEGHFTLFDKGKSLKVFEARPSDNGSYVCSSLSPVEKKEAVFILKVLWPPYFEEFGNQQRVFSVLRGNSVTFDCLSSGSPTPKVIWKKNGTFPITEHTTPGVIVLPTSRHSMTISSVQLHHAGDYDCKAVNKIGWSNRQFLLNVIAPPFYEGQESEVLEVLEGNLVSLTCDISGSPDPVIVWERSSGMGLESKFVVDNNQLIIPDAMPSDSDSYICTASNKNGVLKKNFSLSVYGIEDWTRPLPGPPTIIGELEEEVNINDRENLVLTCAARGLPLPRIVWSRDSNVRDWYQSAFYNSTIYPNELTVFETVSFHEVKPSKVYPGKIICHARNNKGVAKKVFRTHHQVSVAPSLEGNRSQSEDVILLQGLPFSFRCPVVGKPTPSVKWYYNGVALETGILQDTEIKDEYSIMIFNSSVNHSGNFTCIAGNTAGHVSKTFLLNVLVPPFSADDEEEIVIDVISKSELHLSCNFSGRPEPKLVWIKGLEILSPNSSAGIEIHNNGRDLIISSVNLRHSGQYSCVADNEAGSAERIFHVSVLEAPQRNEAVTRNYSELIVNPQRRILLLCAMTGTPSPTITWYKDNILIDPSRDESIEILSDGRQLRVLKTLKQTAGLYRCVATNSLGTADAFFKLEGAAEWGPWSEWSICSVTCGQGKQQRRRSCQNAFDDLTCQGNSIEEIPCFLMECPVHGGWSKWSQWTDCPQSCGNVKKHRYRKCDNPSPDYGGDYCVGDDEDEQDCLLPPCPVHGGWSDWSDWSPCAVTCGSGNQIKTRRCDNPAPAFGGNTCVGSSVQVMRCSKDSCDGKWSDWSKWSECSVTCGRGHRHRQRECLSDSCTGSNIQFEPCKSRCPDRAALRIWGKINGQPLQNNTIYASVSEGRRNEYKKIIARMRNISKREADLQPFYMPLMVSPVSWNVAYEKGLADNGYSLTKGKFKQESRIQFDSGKEIEMTHIGQGIDSDGQLQVDIEVIGEVPYVKSHAEIIIEPFSEEYIQASPSSIHAYSEGIVSADGNTIPYSWNKTVSYDIQDGTMPYVFEKLSSEDIYSDFDPNLQEMRYTLSTSIAPSCAQGYYFHNDKQQCEDIDECADSHKNQCHLSQLCENLLGSYRCSCRPGFRSLSIGQRCLDVNECLQEPPLCSHDCRNIPGSYLCICPPGTYLMDDKHSCTLSAYWDDPEEAYEGTDFLNQNQSSPIETEDASSSDSVQEFRLKEEEWTCPDGHYWLDGFCQDRDECQDDQELCGVHEICMNLPGTYKCLTAECGENYELDPLTKECIIWCHEKESLCDTGATWTQKKVFMAVAVDKNYADPGADLAYVSVFYDGVAKPVNTVYRITSDRKGHHFKIRQDPSGGILYSITHLRPLRIYRVVIQGDTFASDSISILYSTKFVVFVYIYEQ